ncbi:MAG: hypothetical protein ABR968_13535, partial [Bacteroidales bacterium]
VNDNTPKSHVGFRLGYTVLPMRKSVSVYYGVEIGVRPGVGSFGYNAYLDFKMGFLLREKI